MYRSTLLRSGVLALCLATGLLGCFLEPAHDRRAPTTGPAPESTFSKSYGGPAEDVARAVVAAADGGILLVGEANSRVNLNDFPLGTASGDLWLNKLDANGNVQVQHVVGEQPAVTSQTTKFYRARPSPDGGAILVGATNAEDGSDIAVTKLDAQGNVVWAQSHDSGVWLNYDYFSKGAWRAAASDYGTDVWPMPDGGYLVAGVSLAYLEDRLGIGFPCPRAVAPDEDPCQTAPPGQPGRRFDEAISVVVLRLNADGSLRWTRRLTEEAFNSDSNHLGLSGSSPNPIIRGTAEGGAVVARTLRGETLIYRLLADGSPLPLTTIGEQLHLIDLEQTDDPAPVDPDDGLPDGQRDGLRNDGFVVAAEQFGRTQVIKIDRLGTVEWNRELGGGVPFSRGPSVVLGDLLQHCPGPALPCVFVGVGQFHEVDDADHVRGYVVVLGNDGGVLRELMDLGTTSLERITGGESGAPFRLLSRDSVGQQAFRELASPSGDVTNPDSHEFLSVPMPAGEFTVDGGALYWDSGTAQRLIKTDSRSIVLSDQSFAGSGEGTERALAAVEMAPGRFVIAGQSAGDTGWVLRYDQDSNGERIVWQRRFRGQQLGRIETLAASSDSGVVLGTRQDDDLRLVKLDADGALVWRTPVLNPESSTHWGDLQATADGGFVALISEGGDSAIVARLNAGGELQWRRRYELSHASSIATSTDGGYAIAAAAAASGDLVRVLKLDASGMPQWARAYRPGGGPHWVGPPRIRRSADDGYVIAMTEVGLLSPPGSSAQFPFGASNVALLKVDGAGAVLWSRDYGALHREELSDLVVREDGIIFAAGWSDSLGDGREGWLLKLGPDGLITEGCNALLASIPAALFTTSEFAVEQQELTPPTADATAPTLLDGGPGLRTPADFVTARQCLGTANPGGGPPPVGQDFRLTVFESGTQRGVVTSTPDGIACGTGLGDDFCAADFPANSRISLRADPTGFQRWEQDCEEATGGTQRECVVTLDRDRTIQVNFGAREVPMVFELRVALQGDGRVSGGGLSCRETSPVADCAREYASGTVVTLVAEADTNARFTGWTGDCQSFGTEATVNVTVDRTLSCFAQFSPSIVDGQLVAVTVTGSGTVRDDTGTAINCRAGGLAADCQEVYPDNTVVMLNAMPDPDLRFVTWGGDCAEFGASPRITLLTTVSFVCTAEFTSPPGN